MCNEIYKKNPGKFGPKSIIGRYIRTMNMQQYKDFTYADSDKLNFQDSKQEQEQVSIKEQQQREAELQEKLEKGEISAAEYNTLTMTNSDQTPADLSTKFIMPRKIDESY